MSDDVRAEIRDLSAEIDGIEAQHRIAQLSAEIVRLKTALRRVARYVTVPEPRREAGPHEQLLQQRLENAVGICRDALKVTP